MSDLVLGGTGTVGRGVVEGLLARGREVRVVTRSPDRARALPTGAGAVVADLLEPRTYAAAFSGAERMFLVSALSPTELQEGLAAVNEARRAGIRHIVYLSIHRVERGPHVPHFASKLAIESAIRSSGIPYTLLRPNNFFQNDHRFREAILGYGLYPQPLGPVGVSRVDVRDVAEAAVNALTGPGHEGRTYPLVGPEALTGEGTARILSEALGREIRYAGDHLEAWGQVMSAMLPPWLVYNLKLMYALFQSEGLLASDEDHRATEQILGRPARSFGDFAGEAAHSWVPVPVPLPTP